MLPGASSNAYTGWTQLILVVLLTAGAVWLQLPIRSDRPAPSGLGVRSGVLQNLDARLWQDPFSVVANAAPSGGKSGDCFTFAAQPGVPQLQARPCPEGGKGASSGLAEQITQRSQQAEVKVLIAMVPGGTWVPADEKRRRARYAVLAGLNAEGYAPIDAEHIGYAVENVRGVRISMPYEWLQGERGKSFLLVIWLDGDALSQETLGAEDENSACPRDAQHQSRSPIVGINTCPVSRFATILDGLAKLGKNPDSPLPIAVIGPPSSAFLTAAAQETGLREAVAILRKLNVHWYSPFATLPHNEIKNQANEQLELPNFYRVIASDDALADALVAELGLRRFGSGAAVALVGQWDTAYSRTLRDLLKKRIVGKKIVEASYLRGLDARLPGKDAASKEAGNKERKESGVVERPEGDTQIDYLRRLAGALKEREKSVGRIGAIGVLGNDYYDKLLVLQTLRPVFPDAVFFTTDLDAAMLHEKDNAYTRNLVVASGYGLNLSPILQEDIPPFRDGYQSATYLATRLALSKSPSFLQNAQSKSWLTPQLYEIGRSEAVPLTGAPTSARCNQLADCNYPHIAAFTSPKNYVYFVAPLAMLIIWVVGICSGLTRQAHAPYWCGALLISILVSALSIFIFIPDGEPLAWLQGVSVWPSELLRILASVLSLVLLCRGIACLRATRAHLDVEYFNRPKAPKSESGWRCWCRQGLCCWLSPQARKALSHEFRGALRVLRDMIAQPFSARSSSAHQYYDARVIWDTYNRCHYDADTPYFLRLPFWFNGLGFIVSMVLLSLMLHAGFGLPIPQTPARGELAFIVDWIVIAFAVVAFEALLFFALHESFRAIWLGRVLLNPTRWPAAAVTAYWPTSAGPLASDNYALDAWMDVRFIAAATEPVQRIIFYPFVVLVLLLLARSSLFDGWHVPAMLGVTFTISIVLIVLAALRLRSGAEAVRKHSIKILADQQLRARARGDKDLMDQITAML